MSASHGTEAAAVAFRAPTPADAPAAAALINAYAVRMTGKPDVTVEEVRGWWTQPDVDVESDVVLAVRGGELVGYGDVGDQGNGTALWLDVRGEAPAEVLAELERRALSRAAPGAAIRATSDPSDERLCAALAASGFAVVRSSYRMQRALGEVEQPAWPEGVSVRAGIAGREEPLFHRVSEDAFRDHWGFVEEPYDGWLHAMTAMGDYDPSLWFLAEESGEPAGVCVGRTQRHGDPSLGWVATLAVLPAWRRRGIGMALLLHTVGVFAARGYQRVGLSVDAENTTGAVRLYERAGMEVVRRVDRWERCV